MSRWLAVLLLCAAAVPAWAGGPRPAIVEIAYEGNAVTRASVLDRELVVRVGDPADAEAIERSRQALLDLGLFRRVHARQEAVEGGLRVIFEVEERYYLLPLPRGDAKSDGRYAYGAQFRWDNVAGLNHSLRVFVEQQDQQRQGIGGETVAAASYDAPFVFGSPYSVGFGTGYSTRPVIVDGGDYTESFRRFSAGFSRSFSDGPASQGYRAGAGLTWREQRTSGALAPAAYGEALAPSLFLGYRDFHYRVYSETGQAWRLGVEIAEEGWASDYSYANWGGAYVHYLDVGSTEHQTLHLRASTGLYFSGPEGLRQYGLGGASVLRGYDSNFIEGNAYYYLTLELARPIWRRWLRGVIILEAGNVFPEPEDFGFERVYTSLGAGLRVRFSRFVDFEVELGYSIPLNGGKGKIFASRV